MEKERTTVILGKDLTRKLAILSRYTNKSKTYLISEAISEYVAKKLPQKDISIIGVVGSGDPEFAGKDEKILTEDFGEEG